MLRYDRQTKLGLVALYDIRPGNGAGPFLQPRSPHGANSAWHFYASSPISQQCMVTGVIMSQETLIVLYDQTHLQTATTSRHDGSMSN